MHTKRHYHSLADAAEAAKRTPADLLHYAVQGKLTLLAGIPDSVIVRVYDDTTKSDIEPFLITPQFLALSQSQCLTIEVSGRAVQSDFPAGYCIQVNGELYRAFPTYGRLNISDRWSFWRTFVDGAVHAIELTPDRLFVLHSDLEKILDLTTEIAVDECSSPANLQKDNEGSSEPVRATEFQIVDNTPREQPDIKIAHAPRHSQSEKAMEAAICPAAPNSIIKRDFPQNSARDNATPTVARAKVPAETTIAAQEVAKQQKLKAVKPIPSAVKPMGEELPISSEIARDRSMTILRLKQVIQRTGLSRSTIYDKMNKRSPRFDPTFPNSVSLGTGSVGWVESEVNIWLGSRIKH